jgi:cytochrome b
MSATARHRVWDGPTRIVHWLLAIGVPFQYLSGELDLVPMRWHYVVGYALLGLVLFRVAWGFLGSDTARFARFFRPVGATLRYARSVVSPSGHVGRIAGHNPLGAWSAIAMLACLVVQSVTGLWTTDDILESGPRVNGAGAALVEAMSTIHRVNQKVLLGLVVLHLVAVAWHAWLLREDLVRAMLDGRKALDADPALRFVSWGRAAVVAALGAAAAYALVVL